MDELKKIRDNFTWRLTLSWTVEHLGTRTLTHTSLFTVLHEGLEMVRVTGLQNIKGLSGNTFHDKLLSWQEKRKI
jgi:hypothetical protein